MRLRYTPRARADIAEIYQHIAQYSPRAATAVIAQIRATSRLLSEYPGLGRETDISGVQVFSTAHYPYLVYHSVRGGDLVIVHVRHARRDAPAEI
ncbi:type II toxin-antitoxin system RelE/ParE family toxin [Bradyrhizobium sp. AZCC 1719]|uniref:type II toxin-antitoxin system RelE/ParE family toxin n=1 Tax=Bradyrhizobium sp. AZCC 1719 TaxID=3117028 RepID=UPI003FA5310C